MESSNTNAQMPARVPDLRLNKKKNRLNKWEGFDTLITVLAVFTCFITIYPMWYVICLSVSDPVAAASGAVKFWPIGFSMKSYGLVLQEKEFWHCLLNTVGYIFGACAIMLITTMGISFPLTRSNLWGHKYINYFLVFSMYFSGGMIPTFILVTKLGFYNTIWAILLPGYNVGYIILCRTFLMSIPMDLSEAASIDGASNMTILRKIYLPLSKPIIAVIMIYTIVNTWNTWFGAALYTTRPEIRPLQLYLRNALIDFAPIVTGEGEVLDEETMNLIFEQRMTARQIRYALIVVVTLPIIMVYPFFQKYFTKGIMLGSLKG